MLPSRRRPRRSVELDIVVNNAGIGTWGTIEKTSLEEWRRVHAVNLDGVFLGCKHGIPHLRASGGGSIINLSSVAGIIGTPTLSAYGSSKGAVRQLTKSVALHCAGRKDGIRCNSIYPTFIATPMLELMIADSKSPERTRAALATQIPLGRLGEAGEIAALALYLASDELRFVTGAEFVIDGGLLGRLRQFSAWCDDLSYNLCSSKQQILQKRLGRLLDLYPNLRLGCRDLHENCARGG